MWEFVKQETVSGGVLLYFTKGEVDRNTIVGTVTATTIQELITQWEAEDVAVVTEEVL